MMLKYKLRVFFPPLKEHKDLASNLITKAFSK